MGFPKADIAQQHGVGFLGNELQAEQVLDLEPIDFLGPVPAKLFESLDHREASGFDAPFNDALASLGVLAFDQAAQVFEMVPVLLSALLSHFTVVCLDEGQFEVVQMLGEQRWIGFHEFCLDWYGVRSAGGNSSSSRSWRRVRCKAAGGALGRSRCSRILAMYSQPYAWKAKASWRARSTFSGP